MRYFSFTFIIPYIAFLVNKFSILFFIASFAKVNSSQGWNLLLQTDISKVCLANFKLEFTFTNPICYKLSYWSGEHDFVFAASFFLNSERVWSWMQHYNYCPIMVIRALSCHLLSVNYYNTPPPRVVLVAWEQWTISSMHYNSRPSARGIM